ncbi:MAG: hypothetical protein [Arizlama microvirus]|nr:MAG: hypothetical protein [Arizlama microvirus]
MLRKNVTTGQQQNRRRQSDGERRGFSRTAGSTMAANLANGRPMRGGIRL